MQEGLTPGSNHHPPRNKPSQTREPDWSNPRHPTRSPQPKTGRKPWTQHRTQPWHHATRRRPTGTFMGQGARSQTQARLFFWIHCGVGALLRCASLLVFCLLGNGNNQSQRLVMPRRWGITVKLARLLAVGALLRCASLLVFCLLGNGNNQSQRFLNRGVFNIYRSDTIWPISETRAGWSKRSGSWGWSKQSGGSGWSKQSEAPRAERS